MSFDALDDLVLDVQETSAALGRLAEDESAFRLLVQSFRAQDREGWYEVLKRFDLVNRCDLICGWLCTTHCTLICFDLCGPPVADAPELSLRDFGAMIGKLDGAPGVLEQVTSAVLEQDRDTFGRLMAELGWERHAHYICHWICSVRCRLVCRILCDPRPPRYLISCAHLVAELRRTASGISSLADNVRLAETVERALIVGDYDTVREQIQRAGFSIRCSYICIYLHVWRCVRVCLLVCRSFPIEPIREVLPELHGYARATPALSADPDALRGLIMAMGKEDPAAFEERLKRLELIRYCHWVCFWLCWLWFRRFCIWLCPPVQTRPWFTHVGHFHIYSDIGAATGRTVGPQAGHGGPDYAFFGCLELRGYVPKTSPTVPGAPMRYRFLYEHGSTRAPLVGDLLCPVLVGSRTVMWDFDGTGAQEAFQSVWVRGSGPTPADPTPMPVPPPGTPWGALPNHVITPDADGWITVDQQALGSGFASTLIGFNTPTILPGGPAAPGVAAGSQIPTANLKSGSDIAIIFEATRVGGPTAPPDYSNTLARIRINNWWSVALLDLQQFLAPGANGCTPLSNELDALYTADHEDMLDWRVDVSSAGLPASPLLLVSGAATRSGGAHSAFSGVPPYPPLPVPPTHVDISSWPPCSYTVTLSTLRKLTTGLYDDSLQQVPKTFCIGARNERRR